MSAINETIDIHPAAVSRNALRLEIHPLSDWPRMAPVWEELFQSSSNSFFLSRKWTETWIDTFGPHLNVSILLFATSEGPAGVCLAVDSKVRHAFIPMHRLSLNASGEDCRETTYIEYNDVLCRPGWEEAVAAGLAEYALGREWDEFTLDGFRIGPVYHALKNALTAYPIEEETQPCYYVDLGSLRERGARYETIFRSHRRKNLRRNIRAYSALGSVRLEEAGDAERALGMFEELANLNRRRWAALGRRTAFEMPRFLMFHRNLIRRCFAEHSIQLLRLKAGDHTVGILYNLISGGRVHFYQCGYGYEPETHRSPGLITHAYAIQHCIERGLEDWDFLSGDSQFKQSLSTGSRSLVWASFRRPNLKTRILTAAQAARRELRRLRRVCGEDHANSGSFDE